jgi:hypothetical protein
MLSISFGFSSEISVDEKDMSEFFNYIIFLITLSLCLVANDVEISIKHRAI